MVLAETLLLGENLLPLLLLAFGGAMAVGSFAALLRPPARQKETDLERPPRARTILFGLLGTLVAVWALATLIGG